MLNWSSFPEVKFLHVCSPSEPWKHIYNTIVQSNASFMVPICTLVKKNKLNFTFNMYNLFSLCLFSSYCLYFFLQSLSGEKSYPNLS